MLYTYPSSMLYAAIATVCAMNSGQRIAARRKSLDMSQGDLARKIGISRAAVSQIENGDTKGAKPENLLRICRALRASPDWIVFGELPIQPRPASTQVRVIDSEILADILKQVRELWGELPADEELAEIISDGYARTMQLLREQGQREINAILADSYNAGNGQGHEGEKNSTTGDDRDLSGSRNRLEDPGDAGS